jgi:hypothetical protein
MKESYGHILCYFLKIVAVLNEIDLTVVWLISLSFSGHHICTHMMFLIRVFLGVN